ncbi:MAG: RsmE family RNA methyltransferase [Rickettsiaceae bacterium]|nr:RsmE family RNA methyltransferase [Rickettsiaceae bacterium]
MKFSHLSRVYSTESLAKNQTIIISGEDFHYLKSVIRLRVSDGFRLFNAQDGEFLVKITEIGRSSLTVVAEELLREIPHEKPLALAMCIIKQDRMFEAIKAAVQLGVTQIIPIISERTQYKKLAQDRVHRCIRQAIEQSERFVLTEPFPPVSLSEFCSSDNYEQIIAACESEDENNKIINLESIKNNVAILIGPEGGFSEEEVQMMSSVDRIDRVSLGASVLRAETAAIAAIASVTMLKG